jgi:PAS domain S-box-containing protein
MVPTQAGSDRLRRINWLLLGLTALLFVTWQMPPLGILRGVVFMSLPMHAFAETFAIIVSMLVFALVLNTYTEERPGNILILACAFLVVGLLDFGHMLSYKGMPDWVTAAGTEKGINFWLLARLVAALALLTVALRPWRTLSNPHTRNWLLGGSLAIAALLYWVGLFHAEVWPHTFIEGQGLTAFKIGAEYGLIAILLVPATLFYRRAKRPQTYDATSLFAAAAITILSELCFTLYTHVADVFNLLGHAYKIVAYFFIYKAVFVASVRVPLGKLKDSEQYNRMLFDSSPIGLALCTMDGLIVDANQSYANILGRDIDEVKKLTYWQITPGDYAVQEQQQLESLRKNKGYGPYEKEYLHKDGRRVPVRLTGVLIEKNGEPLIWSSVVDITAEVAAARALQESEQHLRQLAGHIREVFWLTDIHKQEMIYISPAYEKIWGRTCESLYTHPRSFLDAIHPDDRSRVERAVMQQKDGPYDEEYRVVRPDGTVRWLRDRAFPVKDQDGITYRLAGVTDDVTETKLARELLEKRVAERTEDLRRQGEDLIAAKEDAERASNAKSQFLSSMSHELRTPLNAILGFSQVLEMDTRLSKDQLESISEIHYAGRHLLDLINEVLDLARIESGKTDLSLEGLDLRLVVMECLALAAPMATKYGVGLPASDPDAPPIYVRADRTRLRQIVLNLISNAVKYNRKGGTVGIECSTTPDGQIRLSVRDTGRGIANERFAELFEPFNRLGAESSDVEGTGIGLTIVKRLVEMMSGSIGVESEPGQGSTFWIDLPPDKPDPAKESQAGATNPGATTRHTPAGSQRTVLYIEDNKANLLLVESILARRPNYTLIGALLPEQGIELAHQRRPDLILLDINLPGMSGYDVLQKLGSSENTRDIPVIAVTADAMSRDVKRGKESGFKDYLKKPINVAGFLDVVDHWLKQPGAKET